MMVQNEKGMTWKADIERALREIGRPATTSEVFDIVSRNRRMEGRSITKHSRHGVRRILQSDFEIVPASQSTGVSEASYLFWMPQQE